jgi:hypothetical protein
LVGPQQDLHHRRQSLARIGFLDVSEPSPALVVEAAPGARQRRAVFTDIGEVSVKAAIRDVELLAQAADAESFRSAVSKHFEPCLNPIIDRQLAADTARRRHIAQHTSLN